MFTRKRLGQFATVWIICLVAISLQPYRPVGESESLAHRAAHVFTFGVAALALLVVSDGRKQQWTAALGVFGLAVAIETAQHLMYKNVFEWWDVRDDVIGVLVAVLIIRSTPIRRRLLSDRD